jgi:hypothetical protein
MNNIEITTDYRLIYSYAESHSSFFINSILMTDYEFARYYSLFIFDAVLQQTVERLMYLHTLSN